MTRYPEVQKKAQQELDAVVGNDRLPTIADREHLPYLRALVSEVLRWYPIGPLGRLLRVDLSPRVCNTTQVSLTSRPKMMSTEDISFRRGPCSFLTYGPSLSSLVCFVTNWDGRPLRYMTRDPEVYSDQLDFKPERFLEGEGRIPEQDPRYVFGFGRR